jgi:hypothetical protein
MEVKMKQRLVILTILMMAFASCCLAAAPPLGQRSFFFGSKARQLLTTDETVVVCLPVGDVEILSVEVTITTTGDTDGELKILGSDSTIYSASDGFEIDTHSALQTWTATGAQSIINIEGIEPCGYLSLTAEFDDVVTVPREVEIKVRGIRYGQGGEQIW